MNYLKKILLTKFKSNNPIVPQFKDPIKTNKKESLSNKFSLHMIFHSNLHNKFMYMNHNRNIINYISCSLLYLYEYLITIITKSKTLIYMIK